MKDLEKFVLEGIVTDLFKAERALSVIQIIGSYSKKINELDMSIRATFRNFQDISLNELISSTARIYDRPNPRNVTRCLETLFIDLQENYASYSEVNEIQQTILHLKHYNMPDILIESLLNQKYKSFTKYLGMTLYNDLLNLSDQRKIIHEWRDKILSHNDFKNKVEKINLSNVELLLEFGWTTVTIVGWTYLNTIYGIMGDNHLKRDAKLQGFYVEKTIELVLGQVHN